MCQDNERSRTHQRGLAFYPERKRSFLFSFFCIFFFVNRIRSETCKLPLYKIFRLSIKENFVNVWYRFTSVWKIWYTNGFGKLIIGRQYFRLFQINLILHFIGCYISIRSWLIRITSFRLKFVFFFRDFIAFSKVLRKRRTSPRFLRPYRG